MRKLIAFTLAASLEPVLMAKPADPVSQQSIKLTVLPGERRYSKNAPVEILVLLENTDPALSWTLIPRLVTAAEDSHLYPEPYLTIRVTGPRGSILPQRRPIDVLTKRLPPSTCDFASLGPSALVGVRLSLAAPPYGLVLSEAGRYKLNAALESRAGAWLTNRKRRDSCSRDFSRIFDGVVESEEVVIDIE
jgi:hypothetical protein